MSNNSTPTSPTGEGGRPVSSSDRQRTQQMGGNMENLNLTNSPSMTRVVVSGTTTTADNNNHGPVSPSSSSSLALAASSPGALSSRGRERQRDASSEVAATATPVRCINPASDVNSRLDTQVEVRVYPCNNSQGGGKKKFTTFTIKPEVSCCLLLCCGVEYIYDIHA